MSDINYNLITEEVLNRLNEKGYALEVLPKKDSIAGLWLSPVIAIENGEPKAYQIDISLLRGDPGASIELQKTSTHLQWRVKGTSEWTNLVAVTDLQGPTGKNVELNVSSTYLQWRVVGETIWNNLIAIESLKVKGDTGNDFKYSDFTVEQLEALKVKGDPGASIELQKTSTHLQWRVKGTSEWTNLVAVTDLQGPTGKNVELNVSSTYLQWRVVGETIWNNLIAIESLKVKGDTGNDFKYSDFTVEQLEALTGPAGPAVIVRLNTESEKVTYWNWDLEQQKYIDTGLSAVATVDISNVPIAFEHSDERVNIESGDTVPSAFGKIWKWFDWLKNLGSLAWKNNLTWAEIANKPDNIVIDANYVHTDNNYSDEEKNKLAGIEEGAQVNVPIIHKATTLLASGWVLASGVYTYNEYNSNIVDGCDVWISLENDTREIAFEADLLKPKFAEGRITFLVSNLPAGDINITYSIKQ